MIRKFVTASMMIALLGVFYFTDRFEQSQSSVTVSRDLPRITPSTQVTASTTRSPASMEN